MKSIAKIILALAVLAIVLLAGAILALKMVDTNKYRGQIATALSEKIGRTVKLNGPIKFGLSEEGITLSIQKAAIGNPSWASHPHMADIGQLEVGVALRPLLDHRVAITGLKIARADIELETGAGGKNNWDMQPMESVPPGDGQKTGGAPGSALTIGVDHVSIRDSQFIVHDNNGKTTAAKIRNMGFDLKDGDTVLRLAGEWNGTPLELNATIGTNDLLTHTKWPFAAEAIYAGYHLQAKGKADLANKTAALDAYAMDAGASSLHGQLAANWAGARPFFRGTVNSNHWNPADFKAQASGGEGSAGRTESGAHRVFSDAPLPLDGLKSIDAVFDVNIAELALGNAALKSVAAKFELADGHLLLPIKAALGDGQIASDIKLNAAATPAQLALTLSTSGLDLGDLLHLLGAPAFLSGKGVAAMNLGSSGDSMHALAGNLSGTINVTAASGDVSGAAADDISSGLMNLFSPGGGTNTLNCLAARFIALHGVVKDNGILVDTGASTIAGKGGFDLGAEIIDMRLRAKTKMVNVGGLLPALHISGAFLKPKFGVDTSAVLQTVTGVLTSGSINDGVPEVGAAPVGQNACVYALDHPPTASPVYRNTIDTVADKVKNTGGQLMQGLFGQ